MKLTDSPTGQPLTVSADEVEKITSNDEGGSFIFCKRGKCSEIFRVQEKPEEVKRRLCDSLNSTSRISVRPPKGLVRGFFDNHSMA